MATHRRHRKWLWTAGILLVLLVSAYLAVDRIVGTALHEVAGQVKGYRIDFGSVDVAPLRRILRIHDLEVHADSSLQDSLNADHFDFEADLVRLDDVDLWALISDGVLHVRRLQVDGPVMKHFFRSLKRSDADRDTTDVEAPAGMGLLRLDTLLIRNATLQTRQDSGGTRARVEDMDLFMGGLTVHVDEELALGIRSTRLHLAGIEAELEPFYTLTIDSLRMERPALRTLVQGLHLTPQVGPNEYGKLVDRQIERYQVDIDSLQLDGFGLVRYVRDGVLRADSVRMAGLVASIHRDKTIPLGDQPRKPLPSEALLALEKHLHIGLLRIDRGELHYHEKPPKGGSYGEVAFTDIAATATGIGNVPRDSLPDLVLTGDCRINGQGRAHLDLRLPMGPAQSPLVSEITLYELPATALNHLTNELVHIDAVEGTIHGVAMQLSGDDHAASGVVDIHYEDLKVALSQEVKHAGLLSAAANLVVRAHNMPDRPGYRNGPFRVVRDQHKSVFNYLWIGLRQGLLEVILPELAQKELKKKQEHRKRHHKQ